MMKITEQAVKTPPCAVVETFACVLSFDDERLIWSKDMLAWGNETYGPFARRWAVFAPEKRIESAYFHSREEAMLFVMRWCGV